MAGHARGSGGAAARAFDIRLIIALLFALYGVVLTAAGLLGSDEETNKAAGVNINLWAGLGMLAAAAAFALWARLRPVALPERPVGEDGEEAREGGAPGRGPAGE
ncbi:hypothetical protein [Streptomyces sp. B6B3]|uniref:hypothetical protein n=1 Tax=Streptomyces sp. B6B3 TaxID=3153570 RepID=UPI00325D165D